MMKTILLVVLVAVLAIVALIAAVVLVRRYLTFRRRVAETTGMKQDLMLWKNLYGLVRGGDGAMEAKATLSSKLGQVKAIFMNGLALIRQAGKRPSQVPWFVLVGEPGSGKTSLYERSGLEFRTGVSPEMIQGAPLVTWLGPKSYTLDVSGRVFFDRWLKGSGAEWNLLVRSIRLRNRRFPLSGIILTIPADALLTDDATLTREKASIIGNELQRLLKVTGMNLPCHVVVTKLDMLLGFREYFAWLEGRDAAAPFGWQNPLKDSAFDEQALAGWLDELDGRLRENMMARLLDPKILRDPAALRQRVDTAGTSSLFPDGLSAIRGNLSIYLNRLFGKEAWNGHDQLLLGGVFFTSARDDGTTISPEFAALCGKSAMEGLIVSEPKESADGRFIGGLLSDFVFARKVKASFTARELFIRQIPGYLAAAAVVAIGLVWIFVATFGRGEAHDSLNRQTAYYRTLAERVRAGDIAASPIVASAKDGRPVLLKDEPMRGDERATRIAAFCQAQMFAEEEVRAPFGSIVPGFIWFGFDLDLAGDERREIANRLQTAMVFRPTFAALTRYFQANVKEPFSRLKREAMFSFFWYMLHSDTGRHFKIIRIVDVLQYMFPDMGADVIKVLSTFHPDTGYARSDYEPERYAESPLASEVVNGLGKQFGEAWKNLEIYGETLYPKTRSVIRSGDEFRALMSGTAGLAKGSAGGVTNGAATAARWQAELERMSALRKAIDRDAPVVRGEEEGALAGAIEKKFGARMPGWMSSDPLKDAVADYRARLRADADEYDELMGRMEKLVSGRYGADYMRQLRENDKRDRDETVRAFDAEVADLRTAMGRILGSRLLDNVAVGTDAEHPGVSAGGIRHYAVAGNIVDAALSVRLPEEPKDLGAFFRTMETLVESERTAEAKLAEAAGVCTNDQLIASFAADVSKMMDVRARAIREQLLASYARLHPRNGEGVGEMVASLKAGKETFGISAPLATEVFGGINAASMFDPNAAEVCFGVYSEMMELAGAGTGNRERGAGEKGPGTGTKAPINLPNRHEIEVAMGEYIDSYIDYWANFGDRLRMPCVDWEAYRKLCATIKPYEVNTLLAIVYRKSIAILSAIPKACLDKGREKDLADAVTLLESRIQMLTPHFSDVCLRQATDWSLLHADPTTAYRFLRECPATVLVADYFAVDAAGAKGDVPWWTAFFDIGLDLLKRDARRQGVEKLRRGNGNFLRFPLCADPVNPDTVKSEELDDIQQLLVSCGFAPVAAPSAPEGEEKSEPRTGEEVKQKAQDERANRIVAKVRAPYRADSATPGTDKKAVLDYFEWGERMHAIVDTLRDCENETIWTLSLTPLEKCQTLNEEKFPVLPIANYRYRYGELTVGGETRGGKVALNSAFETQIARGTIDDADIVLRLDAYSDPDDTTSVKLNYEGPWAILRIYLLADSVYDRKTKSFDVPIIVRDRYNLMSVLWVTCKINRSIPKPAEWPSTGNWPDIPMK